MSNIRSRWSVSSSNIPPGDGKYSGADPSKSVFVSSKPKKDTRTDQGKLVDYLVRLNSGNPYDSERKDDTNNETYLEGYGGKNGFEPEYWLPRWERGTNDKKRGATDEPKDQVFFRSQDNTVFKHANKNVREFFELGGYRAFPEVVTVWIEVCDVFSVDVTNGTFRVSFVLTTRWYDQVFDSQEYKDEGEVYSQTIPYITFDHVHEGDAMAGVPRDAAGLSRVVKHHGIAFHKNEDPPGVLYHSHRIQATFRVANDLHDFPFDMQKLYISVRLWGSRVLNDIDHGRVLLPLTCEVRLAHAVLEWRVHQATAMIVKPRFGQQHLMMVVPLTRDHQFFAYNVYLILFCITSAAFLAFAVQPGEGRFIDTLENRLSITLTLVLTSIAYKFYLEPMLPHAPYLTEIDWYLYGSFFTILGILFSNCFTLVVEFLESDENATFPEIMTTPEHEMTRAAYFDAVAFYVMLVLWITFNGVRGYRIRNDLNKRKKGVTPVVSEEDKIRLRDTKVKVDDFVKKASDLTKKNEAEKKKEYENIVTYADEYNTLIKRRNKALAVAKISDDENDAELKKIIDNESKSRDVQLPELSVDSNNYVYAATPTTTTTTTTTEHQQHQHHHHQHNGNDMENNQKTTKLEFHELSVSLRRQEQCNCCGCVLRQQRSTTLDIDINLHKLRCFFSAAGMTNAKAGEVSEVFMSFGIMKEKIVNVFNKGAGVETVTRLLEMMSIGVEQTVKVLDALTSISQSRSGEGAANSEQAKILCLQGSISYVMKQQEIGLQDQLVETSYLKEVLVSALENVPLTSATRKTLTDVANQLYTSVLLQASPYTDAQYVFSQRKCKPDPTIPWPTTPMNATTPMTSTMNSTTTLNNTETQNSTRGKVVKFVVKTQVWCGYLASKFVKQEEWKESMGGAFCIDIGTSKIALGYAEMQWVKDRKLPVIRSHESKELSTNDSQLFEMMDAAISAMDVRTKHPLGGKCNMCKAVGCKDCVDIEFRDLINDEQIEKICKPLVRYIDECSKNIKKECCVVLTKKEPIFIFGTMAMRTWTKKSERKHGARCHELLAAMAMHLNFKYSEVGDYVTKVYIEVCEQSHEAQYEHLAFLTAIQSSDLKDVKVAKHPESDAHAVLTRAFANNTIGNLACGKGSMQGIPNVKTVIMCELGLNKIEEWIESDAPNFGGKIDKVVGGGKTYVYFDNDVNGTACMKHLQTKILEELKNLSPQFHWKDNKCLTPDPNTPYPNNLDPTDPVPTDSVPTDPVPTDSVHNVPISTDPVPVDNVHVSSNPVPINVDELVTYV